MGDRTHIMVCGDRMCQCQYGLDCDYSPEAVRPALLPVSIHEANLRSLRCCLTARTDVTLHHCHGGSMKDAGWHVGVSQKQNPFLQLPLHADYHTGDHGIDRIGVETWEDTFVAQVELLREVNGRLPYDIFQMAVLWEMENRGATASRSTAIERLRSTGMSSTARGKPIDTGS